MALSIWATQDHRRLQAHTPQSVKPDPVEAKDTIAGDGQEQMASHSWGRKGFAVIDSPEEEAAACETQYKPYQFEYTHETLPVLPSIVTMLELPTQSHQYRVAKRVLDLSLSVLLMPLISVLLVLIGSIIAITSGLPFLYGQERIGQHGRIFKIWKFRTMKTDADDVLAQWLKESPAARLEWQQTHKLRRDPRITALGKFLRKTSLDELPQIFNVLKGEMSLVGPRPIVHAERAKYADRFTFYAAVIPGITGLWQVSGRCNVSYAARVKLDEHYVRTWNIAKDIHILVRTPKSVLYRHGAY